MTLAPPFAFVTFLTGMETVPPPPSFWPCSHRKVRDLPNRDGNTEANKTNPYREGTFVTFLTGMETEVRIT